MKHEYSVLPSSMAKADTYGFSWMEFVTAIPAPLFVVTSYKSNGKPNACMQSWACFNGDTDGTHKFYALLSNVKKTGHLYQTVKETGAAVLNFPSADIYEKCMATIDNNCFDDDEITLSGLTAEPATVVQAPRIKECFMNLECRYVWEKEITEGASHAVMCLEVVNVCVEETHLNENSIGRYGDTGFLYNIHHPVDPEHFTGKSHGWAAVLHKIIDAGEY